MKSWIEAYLKDQAEMALKLPIGEIQAWIELLRKSREKEANIFACGNGGSAANCSHFAVDLGKGASGLNAGKIDLTVSHSTKRFRVMSLNDNTPWMTALGNDCSYDDIFVEQLKNYGRPGDLLIAVSVSGNSPNLVKAIQWANSNQMITLGLVGNRKENQISKLAQHVIRVEGSHYGRVEDSQMHVLHMLCYAFIETI